MSAETLYTWCKRTGATIDSHESDLYILADKAGRDALRAYRDAGGSVAVSEFIATDDGRLWYDAPFAFDPFWGGDTPSGETAHLKAAAS